MRRVVSFTFAATLAAAARAEPPAVFELSVTRADGAGSCPSGNEFARQVSARLGRVPFSERAEQAIEAVLAQSNASWRAEIVLRDADGIVRGRRRIDAEGEDCRPLAEAATLAIALTIDPEAPLTAEPPLAPQPPPATPPSTAAPEPAPPSLPAPADSSETQAPRPDLVPPRNSPLVAASLRGVLAGGVLPGAAPGVAVNADVGLARVRVTLGLLYLPEQLAPDPRFAFGLTSASLGACGFPLVAGLELGLCGELQLGGIHAVVRDLQPLDPGDQLWFAIAAGPRFRVKGPGGSFVELGGAVVVPVLDRTFEVAGLEEPAFSTATAGGLGFIGVGLRAP